MSTWARDQLENHWSAVNLKKYVTSISSTPEPAIWSCDTGQRTPCFDSCQLTITWKFNIKDLTLTKAVIVLWLTSPSPRVCTDGRSDGRTLVRSRDYQIFLAWWFTKISYPWCSASALRALELRYNQRASFVVCMFFFFTSKIKVD